MPKADSAEGALNRTPVRSRPKLRGQFFAAVCLLSVLTNNAYAQASCGSQGNWEGVHSEVALSNRLVPVFSNYFIVPAQGWTTGKPERTRLHNNRDVGDAVCTGNANKLRGGIVTLTYIRVPSTQDKNAAALVRDECNAKEKALRALSPERQAAVDEKKRQTRELLGNKGGMASLTPEEAKARQEATVFENRMKNEQSEAVQPQLTALLKECGARRDPLVADVRYNLHIQINPEGEAKGNDQVKPFADLGDKSIRSGPNDKVRRILVYATPTSQGAKFNADRVTEDLAILKDYVDIARLQALIDNGGNLPSDAELAELRANRQSTSPPGASTLPTAATAQAGATTTQSSTTTAQRAPARATGSQEPPAGQYLLERSAKSKIAPGERFEHDPNSLPKRDARWTASYENFVAPQASTRYADGPRSVTMEINVAHENYKGKPMRFKRVLSNPYIPTERVDLPNPNWVVSPYYSQGFFSSIQEFSCRPNGTLFVRGEVGVAADSLRGATWARGIWRIVPDGKILPVEVFPNTSSIKGGKHSCSTRTCELAPHEPRERAIAQGSLDWVQDKHGNVWGIRGLARTSTGNSAECFVKRFNVDGTDTVIQDHEALCAVPQGYSRDFRSDPRAIVYDEARDEVVYSAGMFGGNTDGSWALFRANQAGQVKELLRNWAQADGAFGPNPPGKRRSDSNQVSERWWGIYGLVYNRASRAVEFEVSVFNELNYPGRTYEIKDTFSSLKRLPYNSPGQVDKSVVFGKGLENEPLLRGDDQKLLADGSSSSFISTVFGQSCFDDAGNRYFMNSHSGGSGGSPAHASIRRMDPQGRLSTWVK